jgi:hypothetical protein
MQGFGGEIRRKDMNLEDLGVDRRKIENDSQRTVIKGRGIYSSGSV